MKLTKQQVTAFDYLIATAFIQMRTISKDKSLDPETRNERIHQIANAFHNIPWMIAEEEVDAEKVLSDLSIAGGALYTRGKEILLG